MNKVVLLFAAIIAWVMGGVAFAQRDDIQRHPSCSLCGMDREKYAHSRMFIEYAENKTTGTCSIHCAASEISVNRDKTMLKVFVADYLTKKLIPADQAFWVVGGNKMGVMTKRAKWAFGKKGEAERFIKGNGGQLGTFHGAMKATFEDMYEDIKMIREKRKTKEMRMVDVKNYPECKYCGMMREKYAQSRTLIEYDEGSVTGTCSVHCLSIDLALNTGKTPKAIMVGDYDTESLVNAETAFWVLGGKKKGVMSIRGKWAFEKRNGANRFVEENGGRMATFDEVMKAAFEDMYEIIR